MPERKRVSDGKAQRTRRAGWRLAVAVGLAATAVLQARRLLAASAGHIPRARLGSEFCICSTQYISFIVKYRTFFSLISRVCRPCKSLGQVEGSRNEEKWSTGTTCEIR